MTARKKTPSKQARKKAAQTTPAAPPEELFDRVAGIIEQARGNIVRAVNRNMVLAYWLIGREIVQEIQGGKGRAAYGRKVLSELSRKLTERYGAGYSETTLQYFRKFHQVYADRCLEIPRPLGVEFPQSQIPRPMGVELTQSGTSRPMGDELGMTEGSGLSPIRYPMDSELAPAFSPQLSWSHYRALMRVEDLKAREFYEQEAIAGGWDKRTLERQIQSSYYQRLLKSQHPESMLAEGRHALASPDPAIATLKHPYVLEFLGLPEVAALQETDLEQAILSYLPTEEELRLELERERRLIETHLTDEQK